jgi:hypothetical protein
MQGDHLHLPQVFLHKPYLESDLDTAIDTALKKPVSKGQKALSPANLRRPDGHRKDTPGMFQLNSPAWRYAEPHKRT